jgi:hypothetical protein
MIVSRPVFLNTRNLTRQILLLAVLALLQSGCIWKLWSKEKPAETKILDVYGTVETIDKNSLVIQAKNQKMSFSMIDSSIKGSDFGPGALVHVYYRVKDGEQQVTMVVEKVDN